jgi:hypothetical protein
MATDLSSGDVSPPPNPVSRATRFVPLAAVLLPSLLTLVLLWLPFGFGMSGHIEEWGLLGLYNTYGAIPFITADGPLAAHAVRPLMSLPFWGSYALSPDSFAGWHWVLLAGLLAKGAGAALLARHATGSWRWAVVFAPLVLLYPADTMQLSFRSQHINWSIALALLASALMLHAAGQRRATRYWFALLSGVLLLTACAMYEAALTLAPLALLIVFIRHGFGGTWHWLRSHSGVLLLLWSGAVAYLLYGSWVATQVASYQSTIAGGSRGAISVLVESLPKLISIGFSRLFLGGWRDALAMLRIEYANYAYLALAACLLAVVVLTAWRRVPREPAQPPSQALRMAGAGLLAAAFGYAPFLLLPSHMAISQRTFLWATPGAALVCLSLLLLLARRQRWLAAAAATLLLGAGMGAQLFQFHHYSNVALLQQAQLRAIVSTVDGNLRGKTLLVLDESNSLGHTWTFIGNHLQGALTYIYGKDVGPVHVCHMPGGEWQHADGLSRKGSCGKDAQGWVLMPAPVVSGPGYVPPPVAEPVRLATENLVVVVIRPDFSAVLASESGGWQHGLVPSDSVARRRLEGVLAPFEARQWIIFADQLPSPRYRWSFGNWWSMELPTRGSGWREAEWEPSGTGHVSRAWQVASEASVEFPLTPQPGSYLLRGKFGNFASAAVRQSVTMAINGQAVPFQALAEGGFEAVVDAALLKRGLNRFSMQASVDAQYYGLAGQLDWFELAPR